MAANSPEKISALLQTSANPGTPEYNGKEAGKEYDVPSDVRSVHTTHSTAPSEQSTVGESQDIEIADDVLQRTITPKSPLVKVPRSKRRGLFSRFAIVAEVTQPFDYKDSTKWFITFIVAVAAAAAPIGSSIILRKLVPLVRCPLHC